MSRKQLLIVSLILCVALGAYWWWLHSATAEVNYVTTTVDRGDVVRRVTASGSINPVVTVQVGTYVSGVIKELHCDFNTRVKRGQLCAKIDPGPYQTVVDQNQANLSAAQAQLGKDKANLELTRTTYERSVRLLEAGYISQDALDAANNEYHQAIAQIAVDEATIKQRQAQLSASKVNLNYTDIVSPVDGIVVSRNVTQGQTVAASFQTPTLFVIADDLTKMQVDTNVSESDIGSISTDNDAVFTVEAFQNQVFRGRVSQVRQSPQSVQNVVTYDVVISASNPDLLLKPGMTAAVRITTQQRTNVLRVADQALRYAPSSAPVSSSSEHSRVSSTADYASKDKNSRTVWVLRNGKPSPVKVLIGLDDDSYAELLQGDVHEGDQLIVGERDSASARGAQSALRMPRL